jgi:signal transduction histidine kinase
MSTSSRLLLESPPGPDVLGELLHSLSQPLTSLRCSLELSLDFPRELPIQEAVELQQESVAVALQQIEKVIGMIQLMREYLEAEQPGPQVRPSRVAPALSSVIDELSSIAAVRAVQLRLVGTCTATLSLPEARLKLALQYLIASLIDAQPAGGKVTLLLGEGPAGTVLRAEAGPPCRESNFPNADQNSTTQPATRNPALAVPASVAALRRIRLAIASRLLEGAGASLVFGGSSDIARSSVSPTDFVLRIVHRPYLPPS